MSEDLITLPLTASLEAAARAMRDNDIGSVVVTGIDGLPCGIVTDRDLVVRGLADAGGQRWTLAHICTRELATVDADEPVERALGLMVTRAVRRLAVADRGRTIGVVSLGDVALEHDSSCALRAISAATANR